METENSRPAAHSDRFSRWVESAFPGVCPDARDGRMDKGRALAIMKIAVERYYPDCAYAFGHGTALGGRYRELSDLDIIIFEKSGNDWGLRREMVEGFPVEFTIYSLDTLDLMEFLAVQMRMPLGLLAADADLLVDAVGDADAFRAKLKSAADEMAGTDRAYERENLRAQLFAVLLDLRKSRSVDVAQAIALTNYSGFVRAATLLGETWFYRSRHFIEHPHLQGSDAIRSLHAALAELMNGNSADMISLTEDLVEGLGGPLWAGRHSKQMARLEFMPVARLLLGLEAG